MASVVCNQQVDGSTPFTSSIGFKEEAGLRFPERPKGRL